MHSITNIIPSHCRFLLSTVWTNIFMFRMPHAIYAIIGVRYNQALRWYVFGYPPNFCKTSSSRQATASSRSLKKTPCHNRLKACIMGIFFAKLATAFNKITQKLLRKRCRELTDRNIRNSAWKIISEVYEIIFFSMAHLITENAPTDSIFWLCQVNSYIYSGIANFFHFISPPEAVFRRPEHCFLAVLAILLIATSP